jgi:hypothetical protein
LTQKIFCDFNFFSIVAASTPLRLTRDIAAASAATFLETSSAPSGFLDVPKVAILFPEWNPKAPSQIPNF